MQARPPVAIVGAGIAGITCARRLHQAGLPVLVLEKSRGIGGRMSTRRRDDGQWDHGAQYFTARSPEFQDQVREWQQAGVVAPWDARLVRLTAQGSAAVPAAPRWVGTPTMAAPVRSDARSLHVLTSHTVIRLQRRGPHWELVTREFGTLPEPFSAVLLALPAPQASALLATAAPDLLPACQSVTLRPCWAVLLGFQHDPDLPFEGAFVDNGGPLAWMARNHSKPGRPTTAGWVLHATPEWSAAHLDDPPESVAQHLISAFQALGGQRPDHWQAHRWRYAQADDATGQSAPTAHWHAGLQLGLCGDSFAGGRVEAAWHSGHALAQRFLESA